MERSIKSGPIQLPKGYHPRQPSGDRENAGYQPQPPVASDVQGEVPPGAVDCPESRPAGDSAIQPPNGAHQESQE